MGKEKSKIDIETAEKDFERWADRMDIDIDLNSLDLSEDDEKAFKNNKRKITRQIMRGAAIVNDEGIIEYTPCNQDSKFKETFYITQRSGECLAKTDNARKPVAKMYHAFAAMAKLKVDEGSTNIVKPNDIQKLAGSDALFVEAAFGFLMG